MEIIIYVALGIVLGFLILAFLEDLIVGVAKLFVYAVGFVGLLGVIWVFGAMFSGIYQAFVESPWTAAISFLVFVGVVVFAAMMFIGNSRREEQNEQSFREFCSNNKFNEVFNGCFVGSDVDLTLEERASKFARCAYQLQVLLYHHWVAVDGGESFKVLGAKAKRLNEAAYSRAISKEVQGARIVAVGENRHEQPMKEYHFPGKWGL